jgi:hypothetical protein
MAGAYTPRRHEHRAKPAPEATARRRGRAGSPALPILVYVPGRVPAMKRLSIPRGWVWCLCALTFSFALAPFAYADVDDTASATAAARPVQREVPDYDGRKDGTTAGEVLVWVPRIALSPLYLVSEFVLRRPLGFLITQAERANLPEVLYGLFTFGPDHKAGVLPIAFVDFGFNPSVGLYFFWNDAFVDGHDLRLRGSTWGSDWLAGSLTDRFHLGGDRTFELTASAVHRPDYVFYGVGPDTLESDVSRYGSTRLELASKLDLGFWRASRFSFGVGVRSVSFHPGHYRNDPTLEQQAANGAFEIPDGYERGYTLIYNRMSVAVDSRLPRPAPGSGVRLEGSVEQLSDVRFDPGSAFVRYGGGLGGFYDLTDHGRVVSLSIVVSFADPLGDRAIPFTELSTIGGEASMRGFVPGRLYDRSAALATLRYRWPIWIMLDGSIQVAVGNVFGEHLSGFSASRLRFSSAIGIESVGSPDSSLELLVGIGSETFEAGAEITSIRIALGTNHGF